MKHSFHFLSSVFAVALLSASAHAACGGGGYKAAAADESTHPAIRTEARTETETVRTNSRTDVRNTAVHNPKLDSLQRDVDAAQFRLDHCTGDCDKERRKLAEAQAKLARRASSL